MHLQAVQENGLPINELSGITGNIVLHREVALQNLAQTLR